MRGAFAKQGIDINKDVQFINIPNPSDHVQALRRGEVELICSVEPFATQIREVKAAKFFAFPYDQAAGKLTNLIVTRSDVIARQAARAWKKPCARIVKVNDLMAADKPLFVDTHPEGHRAGQDRRHRRGRQPVSRLRDAPRIGRRHRHDDARPEVHQHRRHGEQSSKNMDYSFLEAVDRQAQVRARLLTRRGHASRSFLRRVYRRIERAIVPVLLLAGWEIFSRSGILPPALLPAPSQVLVRLGGLGVRDRRQHADLQRPLDLRHAGEREPRVRGLRPRDAAGRRHRHGDRLVAHRPRS